jgi:hypothetical protein
MLVVLGELSNLPVVAPDSPRPQPPVAFLRLADVTMRVGLSRSAIWRMAKEGNLSAATPSVDARGGLGRK